MARFTLSLKVQEPWTLAMRTPPREAPSQTRPEINIRAPRDPVRLTHTIDYDTPLTFYSKSFTGPTMTYIDVHCESVFNNENLKRTQIDFDGALSK